jgi:hypothetical protein
MLLDPLFCRAKDNRKRTPPQIAYFGITDSPSRTHLIIDCGAASMGIEAKRDPW